VRIWNVATGKEDAVLQGHSEAIYGVDVSRDGKILATADGRGGTVRLWDLEKRILLHSLDQESQFVPHARGSPDGRFLAASSWTGILTVVDMATGGVRMHFLTNQGVKWSDFSPDQQWLARGSVALPKTARPAVATGVGHSAGGSPG